MSSENAILFYILVPVYKVEKYIGECIESVLNQSYPNFRLILVDDGSPDAAGQICDAYARKDARLHVIHQKNMGSLAAREVAIGYVQNCCSLQNAYVMFLDSDDTLKQNALARVADVIEQKSCDMVIYGMDRVADGKVVASYGSADIESYLEKDKRKLYRKVLFDQNYNALWRKAIKAELIPTKSYEAYYRFAHGEDLLRSLDLYKAASTVYFLQESLYNYRVNPESITQTVTAENYKVDFTIRDRVHAFLKSEDVFTHDDWAEYNGFCVSAINGMAATIARFAISAQERHKLYRQITESPYYKQNLHGRQFKCGAKARIAFRLLEAKAYWLFDFYGTFRNCCSKIRHRKHSSC
jgi:glycosyltransferase involved in cell wall biosynthesis